MALPFIGSNWDIINASLTTSFAEVTYSRPVKAFLFKARGRGIIEHKKTSGASDFVTFRRGSTADFHFMLTNESASSASLGFFRVQSGTDTLEAYVFYA